MVCDVIYEDCVPPSLPLLNPGCTFYLPPVMYSPRLVQGFLLLSDVHLWAYEPNLNITCNYKKRIGGDGGEYHAGPSWR